MRDKIESVFSKVNKDMVIGVFAAIMIYYHAAQIAGFAKNFLNHDDTEAE